MEKLKRFYRQALGTRITELEAAHTQLATDPAAEVQVRRVAHALRGSGGTYGFPEISEAAAAVEDALVTTLAAEVDALITVLRGIAQPADDDGGVNTPAGSRQRILIVDDDAEIRLLAGFLLRQDGFDVAEAVDTASALDACSAAAPDMILMDVMLGGEDGFAAAALLQQRAAAAPPRLVFLTGATRPEQVRRLEGAAAVIRKPFDAETFAATVRRVLNA
jgi:CheY-like chemotaxis protein/HPt (histidine-containing phosphotransfer) domain-containing protein